METKKKDIYDDDLIRIATHGRLTRITVWTSPDRV